jgi:hypothetical protein
MYSIYFLFHVITTSKYVVYIVKYYVFNSFSLTSCKPSTVPFTAFSNLNFILYKNVPKFLSL